MLPPREAFLIVSAPPILFLIPSPLLLLLGGSVVVGYLFDGRCPSLALPTTSLALLLVFGSFALLFLGAPTGCRVGPGRWVGARLFFRGRCGSTLIPLTILVLGFVAPPVAPSISFGLSTLFGLFIVTVVVVGGASRFFARTNSLTWGEA